MNTKYHPITSYLIVVCLYLTGCAGGGPEIMNNDALNLYHGTAQWIIDGCLQGDCASQIFVRDNLVIYARPAFENVAFVVTDKGIPVEKLSNITGNLINCQTWKELKTWLIDNGFSVITGGAPAYQLAIEWAQSIATMELVPVFSIMVSPPGELPAWIVGERIDS